MVLHREWGALACVLMVAVAGCARSRLPIGESRLSGGAGESGAVGSSGAPGSFAGDGGGAGTGVVVSPPSVPGSAGGDRPGQGGVSGGTTPQGTAGSMAPPPPPVPSGPPDPFDPFAPGANDVLNPQRCATDHPFVLSIDPGGDSGEVRGWLESAPQVVFDRSNLPRFSSGGPAPSEDPDAELSLWWSISELSEDRPGSLWFYAASASTEVAHVSVRSFAAIGDATHLPFVSWSVGPVAVGEVAVFHHIPSDRFVAMRALDLYGTEDSDRRELCAAIDARWAFAPQGSGDFSRSR
jgi:hypothetical protein